MTDQDKDPVVNSSLSRPLLIWSAVLVVVMGWALYDEAYGIRPWKGYQARFEKLYAAYLKSADVGQEALEKQIRASAEYQRLDREMQAAERAADSRASAIDKEINETLTPRIMALNGPFQEVRSHIGALTYEIETTHSESRKNSLRGQIENLKREVKEVLLPGETEKRSYVFGQMDHDLQAWKDRKSQLLEQRVALMKPATDLRTQRDKYLTDRIPGVSADTLAALQRSLDTFDISIRQIHIKDVDLVDRCESCHLGTREPVQITAASMGGNEVYASHPNKELLKIHDPESFGCTPCHGGNGIAVASVEKAHGYNEHWLWPLHHSENVEAGCQQCHSSEIVTEMADTLDAGRETYRLRGCMGCHKYEGFDRDADEITAVSQQLRQLDQQKADWAKEVKFTIQNGDRARSNEEAQRLYQHANDLKVRSSLADDQIEQLDIRSRSLVREVKKVGPDLKEARVKLRKEWIPVWLHDPHAWREGTKMPTFRLDDGEIRAISAYIWQSGVQGELPQQSPATPRRAAKPSKRAAAWPATRWAKGPPNRAALSPPT